MERDYWREYVLDLQRKYNFKKYRFLLFKSLVEVADERGIVQIGPYEIKLRKALEWYGIEHLFWDSQRAFSKYILFRYLKDIGIKKKPLWIKKTGEKLKKKGEDCCMRSVEWIDPGIAKRVSYNSLLKVLEFIIRHVKQSGSRKFSMKIVTMADAISVAHGTLIGALRDLKDAGLLEINDFGSTRYGKEYIYKGKISELFSAPSVDEQFEKMQEEISRLRNRLLMYESFAQRIMDVKKEGKNTYIVKVKADEMGNIGLPI